MRVTWNPAHECDADVAAVARHWDEPEGARVLEVGANQEFLSQVLRGHGYDVTAIDLLPFFKAATIDYQRIVADFVQLAPRWCSENRRFDVIVCTSALEHFGLGTYGDADPVRDPDYDVKAAFWMRQLLKPNGTCYVTVPYGCQFLVQGSDWRVYDRDSLRSRVIQDFWVEVREYFKSAEAIHVPDVDGIVQEKDADQWCGHPPHVTVLLKMRR